MEDETVYAHLLISGHANLFEQVVFVAQGANRRQEPTVAVSALTYIARGHAINVELRCFEDILEECVSLSARSSLSLEWRGECS